MDENPTLAPVTQEQQQKGCISCGNPQIVHGYPNALCEECREKYIKFPIPLWVKIFGGALGLLVLFLLFTMPKTLSAGIGYETGVKAEAAKNYVTEQQEMEDVVKAMPNYIEAKAHLLKAAIYNNDPYTVAKMNRQLGGQRLDDETLLRLTNAMIDKSNDYFPNDSFMALTNRYPDSTGGLTDALYISYIKDNPKDLFVQLKYASVLDNKEQLATADSVLQALLQKADDYVPALEYMGGLKRQLNDTKASFEILDKLLAINHQSLTGLAGKARTYLKMNQPKQALQYVLQAYALKPTDSYTYATMVMAYHFNNMAKERDGLIEKAKKGSDTSLQYYMKFALDVIANKDHL